MGIRHDAERMERHFDVIFYLYFCLKKHTQMKISNRKAIEYFEALNRIPVNTKEGTPINDKLSYAVSKNRRNLVKVIENYNDAILDIENKYCATDKDGIILSPVSYKKEVINDKTAETRRLLEDEVEIEPYYVKDSKRLKTLHLERLMSLEGLLFESSEEFLDKEEKE